MGSKSGYSKHTMEKGTVVKRLFAFFSLVLFSTLILGYLWWGRFQYDYQLFQVIVYVGAVLIVVSSHLCHRDTLPRLGFRWDNFRSAAIGYGTPTLILGSLICGLGWLGGSLRLDRWSDLLTYFAWAAVQQYLLQNFLRLRSENLFGSTQESSSVRGSLLPVLLAASLFALYHLPNYPLVGLTFVGGLFWCFLFTRIPNFFWVWLSQAFLTTLLFLFFKYGWANQFEVGYPGYRYDFYGSGVKVAAGYDEHRNPIIATLPGADRGTPAQVRIFDAGGHKLAEWDAFKELDFSGEISVGDLGFGPGDEVAVAPGPGPNNPPRVRIFDLKGNLLDHFEVEDLDRSYGAWLSIHCGKLYVSPGPGPGRPQQVLEFSPQGATSQGMGIQRSGPGQWAASGSPLFGSGGCAPPTAGIEFTDVGIGHLKQPLDPLSLRHRREIRSITRNAEHNLWNQRHLGSARRRWPGCGGGAGSFAGLSSPRPGGRPGGKKTVGIPCLSRPRSLRQ